MQLQFERLRSSMRALHACSITVLPLLALAMGTVPDDLASIGPRAAGPAPRSAAGTCASDMDCSLNGICTAGHGCLCDAPWRGRDCGELAFLPVTMPQGYGMTPNHTTWGAKLGPA